MFYNPLFDLNRDGKIDVAEWAFMDSVINPERDEVIEEEELEEELEMSGLYYDDLEGMDEDERREALEDAGLELHDYDEF